MNRSETDLTALRDYYDTTDTSRELAQAELDTSETPIAARRPDGETGGGQESPEP